MLADYKNDLANLLRESFGVDVRSKTRTYQKLVLGCLNLLNSVGKILGALLNILVSILPN